MIELFFSIIIIIHNKEFKIHRTIQLVSQRVDKDLQLADIMTLLSKKTEPLSFSRQQKMEYSANNVSGNSAGGMAQDF